MSIDSFQTLLDNTFRNSQADLIKKISAHIEQGKLKQIVGKFSPQGDFWMLEVTLTITSRKSMELSEDEEDWCSEIIRGMIQGTPDNPSMIWNRLCDYHLIQLDGPTGYSKSNYDGESFIVA